MICQEQWLNQQQYYFDHQEYLHNHKNYGHNQQRNRYNHYMCFHSEYINGKNQQKIVHGKRSGINLNNVRRLQMWSNQKMKYATFIHNARCFRVVVQRTHKLVMMGHINFEDHVLIKRWKVNEKMIVMGRMSKDKKKQGNC